MPSKPRNQWLPNLKLQTARERVYGRKSRTPFANAVKRRCEARFGEGCGVDHRKVRRWEEGECVPDLCHQEVICALCEMPWEEREQLGFPISVRSEPVLSESRLEVANGLAVVNEQCSVCGRHNDPTGLRVESSEHNEEVLLPRGLITIGARESAAFMRQTKTNHAEPIVLEQLHADVNRLAVAYLTSSPAVMFVEARQLRDQVFRLIRDHHRPNDSRDLHLIAGQLCGILAYASLDLGYGDEAMTQARATWFCTDLAGHHGLKAWVRGTQSLIARFMGNFSHAYQLAQSGVQYATEGTSLVRLNCGEAQCLAHFEDSTGTHKALNHAKDARDKVSSSDAVGGLFTFSEAKHSYYAGSSLIWLTGRKDARIAEAESIKAIQLWQAGRSDDRSHADEALAHVYLGTPSSPPR